MQEAILFINGEPPCSLPSLPPKVLVACTDGAYHYLKKQISIERLDFISGDLDSSQIEDPQAIEKVIPTPDQNYTDFYKALQILKNKKITKVTVYGASGGEQDHFLGNLSVAHYFKDQMEIFFEDSYAQYFFIPKQYKIKHAQGRMISLYPFPRAVGVTTRGLRWTLTNEDLDITQRIGTRNIAIAPEVGIEYQDGDLLVFVGKQI